MDAKRIVSSSNGAPVMAAISRAKPRIERQSRRIGCDLHLEHPVGDREVVAEQLPRRPLVGEDHRSGAL